MYSARIKNDLQMLALQLHPFPQNSRRRIHHELHWEADHLDCRKPFGKLNEMVIHL